MMNTQYSLSILALGFISYAHAYGDTSSMENCTSLLPEGAQYDVSISMDIDKTTQQTRFVRTLEVESNASNEQQNVEPFIDCVSLLVGKNKLPLSEEEEKEALNPLLKSMVYN